MSLTPNPGLAISGELVRNLRLGELIDAELAAAGRVAPVKTSCVNLPSWIADAGLPSNASRSALLGRRFGDGGADHPLGGSGRRRAYPDAPHTTWRAGPHRAVRLASRKRR